MGLTIAQAETIMRRLALLVLLLVSAGSSAPAGNLIAKACLKAARPGASRALCACIQTVADRTLTRRDQRLAAGFFRNPHRAQVIRQSSRRAHAEFWRRYKAFGAAAEDSCGDRAG